MDTIYFFMRIPKTASTSLKKILETNVSSEEVIVFDSPNPLNAELTQSLFKEMWSKRANTDTKYVIGHYIYGLHEAIDSRPYKYIAFVRHPITRMLSDYFHSLQDNIRFEAGENLLKYRDIVEYILSPGMAPYRNIICRFIGGYDIKTVHDMNGLSEKAILERCLEIIKQDFLFVGRQEHFQEDIIKLGKLIGWKNIANLKDNVRFGLPKDDILSGIERQNLWQYNKADRLLYDHLYPHEESADSFDMNHPGDQERRLQMVLESQYRCIVNLRKNFMSLLEDRKEAQRIMDSQKSRIEYLEQELNSSIC